MHGNKNRIITQKLLITVDGPKKSLIKETCFHWSPGNTWITKETGWYKIQISKNIKSIVAKAACKPCSNKYISDYFIKEARLLLKDFNDWVSFKSLGSEFQKTIADRVNEFGGKGQALNEKLTSDPLRP